MFQQALNVLINCSCQERGEDGCYKCLFAYRNSFHQDFTSSKVAQSLLSEILNHWSDLGEEKSQNLSGLSINSDLESELESRFIQALLSLHRSLAAAFHFETPRSWKSMGSWRQRYE